MQFVDVFPNTPDRLIDLFPAALESTAPAGLYRYQADPATDRYPLTLISPASDRTISSTLGELPRPDVKLTMHPGDAAARGLVDTDLVRVFNELGEVHCTLAIALPMVPKMARIARASTLSIAQMPYIDAARAAGYSHARIVLRHIAPNIAAPYLVMVTAFIAQAILLEASLSFLGLGVTEPTPAWGLMLSGASADFYKAAPWMILYPGLAITLAVFAFNLFGDSLRDWLDPKMKG